MMNPTSGNVDWDAKIIVRKRPQPTATKRTLQVSAESINEIEKKNKPLNKHSTTHIDHRHAAKVDRETDEFHIKHIPLDLSKTIQKARADKGWSQKEFAIVRSILT
ncbi:hypothetical protein HMI54_001585 [Coelomomyces lativittatus]|nr:hypothetical protein HMI54_001585 [Coelomomyces lativittatus]